MEEINDLLEQLHTLLDDIEELKSMDKDTALIEDQIRLRILELKAKTRNQIESSFDIPVILDGELLTFEKAVKKKRYIDYENMDDKFLSRVEIKNDGYKDYYYYLEKEIYHLDVDEENLMLSIRFVNSKKDYLTEELRRVLNAIAHLCITSYGYRLAFVTTQEKKQNIENIYTGTVFNNSTYSLKTYNLIEKLYLKLIEDYIIRVKSSHDINDYVIHKIESHWLIINKKTGATDLLDDNESDICEVTYAVEECFDNERILENSRKTDYRIENLQRVVEDYIIRNKNL
jgi:hypothetical protein